LLTWIDAQVSMDNFSEQIEPALLETKNQLAVLNLINLECQGILEFTIFKLKQDKSTPDHKLKFLLELFVWEPYRAHTWKLIEATKKHIDELPLKVYSDKDFTEMLQKLEELKKALDELGE
jgi:hypothetical protein